MTLLTWLAVWVLASFLLAPLLGAALQERQPVRVPESRPALPRPRSESSAEDEGIRLSA